MVEPPRAVGIAITGPTASGKTALSLRVAREVDAEIISMDSRQVFRGMDIGTAKPTLEQRASVPHHGLDLVHPGQRYSAGHFARDARDWIASIRARNRVPLLVGGTGFFLRALTHPMFDEPDMDPAQRERLKSFFRDTSHDELRRWLDALDPDSAVSLASKGGRQRAARALEVALLSGRPLSWWHANSPAPEQPVPVRVFVLEPPRAELHQRIDARVRHMIQAGLVEEVRALLAAGVSLRAPGMSATGYPEIARALKGELTLDQAVDEIQRATRRYARRQLTWFRNKLPSGAVWLDGTLAEDELARRIVADWQANGEGF
jgi:tRNA dimethylallyltransferase